MYTPRIRVNEAMIFGYYSLPVETYPKTQTHQIKINRQYLRVGENTLQLIYDWKKRASNCRADCCGYFVDYMFFPDAPAHLYAIALSSNPSGSDIYLDKIYKGKTPSKIEVGKGWLDIEVRRDGYETFTEKLWVKEDRNRSYSLKKRQLSLLNLRDSRHLPQLSQRT